MAHKRCLLTDEQWAKIEPLLPPHPKGGRPWCENRRVVEGILWILKTGARWRDLPPQYPSPSTCWRRLGQWEEAGVWLEIWRALSGRVGPAGTPGVAREFRRCQLCSCPKRGAAVGPTRRGKGTKWLVVVDGQGVPLGKHLASASPHESTLIEATLDQSFAPRKLQRLIDDKAADSEPLRQRLADRGIDLIAPQSPQEADARWTQAAPLQTPLDCRADFRLAGQLPSPGRALRAQASNLQRLLSSRLHHDRAQ